MYKKILVPLDGSEFSECSLADVKTLVAGNRETEVVLLRILEPIPEYYLQHKLGGTFRLEAENAAKNDAKDYMDKVAAELKKAGISVTVTVEQGKPADAILGFARKNGAELIVMTTHGRSGPSRFALGSVAEKVIRNAGVPVLSVSPPGCRLQE